MGPIRAKPAASGKNSCTRLFRVNWEMLGWGEASRADGHRGVEVGSPPQFPPKKKNWFPVIGEKMHSLVRRTAGVPAWALP